MTSQSPRNRRTTAPRTTRLRTAAKLAAAALLFGGPASAQQPGLAYGPAPAPFGRPAQPNPAAGGWVASPGGRPPNPATPPQNYALQSTPRPPGSPPSAGGRVLYFQKAAGALVPTPNPDAEPTALAMAGGPGDAGAPPVNPAIPDVLPAGPSVVPVSPPRTLPAVPDRPIVPAPGGEAPRLDPTAPGYVPPPLPAFGPPGYRTGLQEPAPQPQESTSQKRQDLPKPIDEDPRRRAEATRLPSRQVIFTMYDDVELEKLIIRAVREDIIRLQKQSDGKPPEKPVVPPAADQRLEFPSLADIRNRLSPPGVPYVAKTVNYAPNKVVYEPIYVIHRRLHFEEKNTERYGWDLGFVQPFVSTLYFYKDTLLWPNSLASGIETGFWDTSAGKCLPGSPVPYLLYPPGLTVSGMLFEGGIITGTAFILAPVGAAPAAAAAGR